MKRLGVFAEPWIQRDGTPVWPRDMIDTHLDAAIAMCRLRRRMRERVFKIALARSYQAGRYSITAPDGAAMAAEEEADGYLNGAYDDQILSEIWPAFVALLIERQHRGK